MVLSLSVASIPWLVNPRRDTKLTPWLVNPRRDTKINHRGLIDPRRDKPGAVHPTKRYITEPGVIIWSPIDRLIDCHQWIPDSAIGWYWSTNWNKTFRLKAFSQSAWDCKDSPGLNKYSDRKGALIQNKSKHSLEGKTRTMRQRHSLEGKIENKRGREDGAWH